MIFLLKCPKCKHNQKYQTTDIYLSDKRKRCVYCNKSFKVSDNIVKKE